MSSGTTIPTGIHESRYTGGVAKKVDGFKGGYDDLLRRRIIANMRLAMAELKIKSGRALAKRIKVDPSTITRYLAGERTPGLDILYRLHKELAMSANFFLDTPAPDEHPRAADELPAPSQEPALRHGSSRK